jgi:hypothetical protein
MQLSRKIAGEFAAVFLIGAVVGGLVVWDFAANTELKQFMTKMNDSDSVMVDRINKKYVTDYHLTPDEIAQIQPIVKEMAQRMSHIRHQFGIDIISSYADYHTQIAEKLTPEHRAAYEKASSERKKQLSDLLMLDQNPSDTGAK